MANQSVLTYTYQEVIEAALRLIGKVDVTQGAKAADVNTGLIALQAMIKRWQNEGHHLWAQTDAILPLDVGKTYYNIGPSGDECGDLDDFVTTQLSVAAILGDATLTVDSTAGMDGADNILVSDPTESTDGWTAVGGTLAIVSSSLEVSNAAGNAGQVQRTLSGLTVGRNYTVLAGFTLSTSPSVTYSILDGATTIGTQTLTATGEARFGFTANQTSHTFEILNGDTAGTNKTINTSVVILDNTTGDLIGIELDDGTRQWTKIVSVLSTTSVTNDATLTGPAAIDKRIFSFPSLIERPLQVHTVTRDTIPNDSEEELRRWSRQEYRSQTSKTNTGSPNNFYYSPQLTNGRMYIWPTASNVNQVLKFSYSRPIEISLSTNDSPDFPAEWFDVLVYGLALRIMTEYKVSSVRANIIKSEATEIIDQALGFDNSDDSIYIQPDFS